MVSRSLAAVLATVALPMSALAAEAGPTPAPGARPAVAITVAVDDVTPTTALDNPFLPEQANLGDCISALPRPECGSKARGGWRQGLVFGAVAVGFVVIGVRLAAGVRRRGRPRAVR